MAATGRGRYKTLARLDRNESPFGTSASTIAAWERQRVADPRKYGLNRYPDFLHTDMLNAMQAQHGLTVLNYTPLAGIGETANVLADALLRGGELIQSWPVEDPISARAKAWGARVKRVPLDHTLRQDLHALAQAVGPQTKLVHLQNPHSPTGSSFGQAELQQFLSDVAARNPQTHVWVDEAYAPYSTRSDFPNCFAIIVQDPENSKLAVSRLLNTAAGIAGAPTAYLAASQTLTQQTEGITAGFVVPNEYGWANPEGGVSRMGEKAVLELLTPGGQAFLATIRQRNAAARATLTKILTHHRLRVLSSDASFVLARSMHPHLAAELHRHGVLVLGPHGWGRRYRHFIRVSVGSHAAMRHLDRALARTLGTKPLLRHPTRRGVGLGLGGGAAVAAMARPDLDSPRLTITRRDFVKRAGLTGAGAALLLHGLNGTPAKAFPPDEFYDEFNLARMIYHENPVGPSPASLEAVKEVLARGPTCAARYLEDDPADLVQQILRYNRRLRPAARHLDARNVMLLVGSSDGLMLIADTFVAGGTLVGEWPAYRIVRERVWQQGGTVIDVPLRASDSQPDYVALLKALDDHPEAGLVHFNAQNNPVGTVIQRGEFDAFASQVFARHPHTVILVDESDHEWMEPGQAATQPDYLGYVVRGKNLIHLQTFSHIFGLTGLRVGYLMAPRRLIRRMKQKRITHPVNVFGHAAALAALKHADDQIRRCLPVISQGRDYIYSELDKMGLHYERSQGQYVFLDTGADGTAVWAGLIGLGVLTRYGREWGRESWLRVCPGLPDENERFIASLKTVLARPDVNNPPCLPFPIATCPPIKIPGAKELSSGFQRALARDTRLANKLPPLERPYRVTPAAALRG